MHSFTFWPQSRCCFILFLNVLSKWNPLHSQVQESTTEKQAVTREGDLRNGATYCPLTCPAATLRSGARTPRVRGDGPAPPARDAHRDRCMLGCELIHLHTQLQSLLSVNTVEWCNSDLLPCVFVLSAGQHIRQPRPLSLRVRYSTESTAAAPDALSPAALHLLLSSGLPSTDLSHTSNPPWGTGPGSGRPCWLRGALLEGRQGGRAPRCKSGVIRRSGVSTESPVSSPLHLRALPPVPRGPRQRRGGRQAAHPYLWDRHGHQPGTGQRYKLRPSA